MSRIVTPTVISLFSGAGGMDYGFEAAGGQTVVAVERDHDCCETLRASRKWPVIEDDIENVTTRKILRRGGLRATEPDVLIGGPPCQPFSKSGYWASGDSKRLADPRAVTLKAFLRVLDEARPRAFVLENVEGFSYSGKSEGLNAVTAAVAAINQRRGTKYKVHAQVLRAHEHGVPQMRSRLFVVASRDGRDFTFPQPTRDGVAVPFTTAWDALGNDEPAPAELEDLAPSGRWAKLLPSVPEGQNYLHFTAPGGGPELFGWRTRYWSFLLKLAKNRPSWTIQAQPGPATGPFHWSSRRLGRAELARLQTFPGDFVIAGGRSSVQRQIGNAVPSLLAEVVARAVFRQLLDLDVPHKNVLEVPPRGEPPDPEVPAPLHPDYKALVRRHAAHPGAGKGTRARTWADAAE